MLPEAPNPFGLGRRSSHHQLLASPGFRLFLQLPTSHRLPCFPSTPSLLYPECFLFAHLPAPCLARSHDPSPPALLCALCLPPPRPASCSHHGSRRRGPLTLLSRLPAPLRSLLLMVRSFHRAREFGLAEFSLSPLSVVLEIGVIG